MKDRPILFSAPMVRAILAGTKTQTRRVVKPQPDLLNGYFEFSGVSKDAWPEPNVMVAYTPSGKFGVCKPPYFRMPYGVPGDRLWVRETWCQKWDDQDGFAYNAEGNLDPTCVWYRADGVDVRAADGDGFTRYRRDGWEASPWKPSIFMPRWASRITLEVCSVRVERLHAISEQDAIAEGIGRKQGSGIWQDYLGKNDGYAYPTQSYRSLWDSINGKTHPWDSNPWVWVVKFRPVEVQP